ncbi:hypothetical protein ES676_10465 [Bizionia saleffrena]|uniref:DUF4097 domain-containing protein n=1 Tax=Bizionia saleffrena TaxID=291189 RepID=A0A8H2LG35_9FLAO|nr:hypothetical protein [Bizionia saleffrena]TYB72590.1 hypothetical protein ES676_10465 [Bizionia saleffrena]
MKLRYKHSILLLLLPLALFATNGQGRYKKEKTITKSFNVNESATLKVDNSYGNLNVVTWDKNRIEFEITITTTGDSEDKVLQKLNDITVHFSNTDNYVSAITKFNKEKSSAWWKWNSNNSVNMKVNYIIKMPLTNNVDLSNDYGTINLGKLKGNATLNCDYGKIITKELLSEANNITFDYSNNCYFEYIKGGKINADYSDFTISKTNKIHIIADYTKSTIEVAEEVSYNCDYGGITIGKANNVSGDGDYLTVKLGEIYKDVAIVADYGSISIDKLTKNAGSVKIDSDYVGINIGYDSEYAFNFNIQLDYGSLKDADNALQFNKKRDDSSSKYYSGFHLRENSSNTIRINSDYGSVSFYKQ